MLVNIFNDLKRPVTDNVLGRKGEKDGGLKRDPQPRFVEQLLIEENNCYED